MAATIGFQDNLNFNGPYIEWSIQNGGQQFNFWTSDRIVWSTFCPNCLAMLLPVQYSSHGLKTNHSTLGHKLTI
jgi:hypothetical protein